MSELNEKISWGDVSRAYGFVDKAMNPAEFRIKMKVMDALKTYHKQLFGISDELEVVE